MSCCNSKSIEKNNMKKSSSNFVCPKCKNKGAKVQIVTLRSLLKEHCKNKIQQDVVYKFCKTPECKVVYFSNRENHFFTTEELTVKATIKDAALDVNVCYCFGHTRQSVLDDLKTTGETNILDEIKIKMKDPGCFCERSNPQGNCCLGNVSNWIKKAKNLS